MGKHDLIKMNPKNKNTSEQHGTTPRKEISEVWK